MRLLGENHLQGTKIKKVGYIIHDIEVLENKRIIRAGD